MLVSIQHWLLLPVSTRLPLQPFFGRLRGVFRVVVLLHDQPFVELQFKDGYPDTVL